MSRIITETCIWTCDGCGLSVTSEPQDTFWKNPEWGAPQGWLTFRLPYGGDEDVASSIECARIVSARHVDRLLSALSPEAVRG